MNIAIISTNKNKYSETFIHNHVRLFDGNIHFLFDGYLPHHYSTDRGLSSSQLSGFGKNKIVGLFSKKRAEHQLLTEGIEHYLIKNKIEIIFCEYGPSGVEMMPLAEKLRIPLIVHFHGYDAYRTDILESYGKNYPQMFNTASAVVAVSSHMRQQLIGLGCPEEKISLIPYGVDKEIFFLKNKKKEGLLFVSCGRFVKKKAPQLVIKAFHLFSRKFPEAKLIMIGDGDLLGECRDLTTNLGLDVRVQFTGSLDQRKISEIYSKAFAFLQHSVTTQENDSEGTPLAIIEASLSGLPIISTMHGGIPEIVKDELTGFLIQENDWKGMSEKMLWLAENPLIASEMGIKSAELLSSFHLNHYTDQLMKLFENCKNKIPQKDNR